MSITHAMPLFLLRRAGIALWLTLTLLAGSLFSNLAHAAEAIPAYKAFVTDLTGTLSERDQTALEQRLREVHQLRIAEIAILLVPTTGGESIFDYSMRVAEQWKVGAKDKDDGVLLVIAKNDRTSQILVGYGLEGSLTDVASSRILRDVIPPFFRRGDFGGGLHAALDSILAAIQHEPGAIATEPNMASKSQPDTVVRQFPSWFIVALIAVAVMGRFIVRKLVGKLLAAIGAAGMAIVMSWIAGMPTDAFFVIPMFMFAFVAGDSSGRRGRIGGFGGGSGGGGRSGGFGGGGGGRFGGGGASGRW